MILSVVSRDQQTGDGSPATELISDAIPSRYLYRSLNQRMPAGYDTVSLFWGSVRAGLLPWSMFLPEAIRSNTARD